MTTLETRALIAAPLVSPRGVLGVIEAVNPQSRAAFDDDDLTLLDVVAQALAAAMDGQAQSVKAAKVAAANAAWRCEGDSWTLTFRDKNARIRDMKGIRYLAQLLRCADREIHVLELVAITDGPDAVARVGGEAVVAADFSVERLDRDARDAYRKRLLELRAELQEAESFNDPGRAERAQHEIEFLQRELSAAAGFGGRLRTSGGAAERARSAVTKCIKDAIRKIEPLHPALARHLSACTRTGLFCIYLVDPAHPIHWDLG
jgi:GAF domain-containing protein